MRGLRGVGAAALWALAAAPAALGKDPPPAALERAAARDRAAAEAARGDQAKAKAQADQAAAALAAAAAAKARQEEESRQAEADLERALLGLGPNPGLESALARGVAADAASRRNDAARKASELTQQAAREAAAQRQAASLMVSLEAEARALEQRAAEADRRALAARQAEARRRKAAAAAPPPRRTPPAVKPASVAERRALGRIFQGGGEVLRRFGDRPEAGSPATGLRVRAAAGAAVLAAAGGRVIHTGVLDGSGHVLILEFDGGNVLAFSGVGSVQVARGDRFRAGARLAAASNLAHGAVYIEMRESGRSIDPLAWLAAGR